jgi:hypothetical protein
LKTAFVLEIITGLFHRPTFTWLQLRQSGVHAGSWFLFPGLPLLVLGALGRAHAGTLILDNTGGMLFRLFLIHLFSLSMALWLGSLALARLAPRFKSEADSSKTLVLAITAYVPFLLALVVAAFFPDARLIRFIGLTYTILIFGKGTGIMLSTPPAKAIGFTLMALFFLFGINYVLNLFLELLFLPQPAM